MTQEAQELKACPFCGGEDLVVFVNDDGMRSVLCNCCIADGPMIDHCDDAVAEAEAIAAWNRHTPDSVIAELVEAARGLKNELIDRAVWDGDARVVSAGTGVWARFCNALAKLEASK